MSVTRDPLKQDEILLTPKEAARFLRLSESFLAKARMRGDAQDTGSFRELFATRCRTCRPG